MSRHEELAKARLTEELQELRESEENYRDLLESLQVAVVVHAADTSILFCNRQAHELLGLAKDEGTGRIAADPRWTFHRGDGTEMPLEDFPVVQVLNTLEPLQNHVVGVEHPDSCEVTWVLVDAIPKFDEERALRTVLVTFRDITDRKRAEEELRESEERFRTVVTHSTPIVFAFDLDGRIVLSEGKMLSAVGLKPGEAVGQNVFELYGEYPTALAGLKTALGGEMFKGIIDSGHRVQFRLWLDLVKIAELQHLTGCRRAPDR